jgi:hypothetical protein
VISMYLGTAEACTLLSLYWLPIPMRPFPHSTQGVHTYRNIQYATPAR